MLGFSRSNKKVDDDLVRIVHFGDPINLYSVKRRTCPSSKWYFINNDETKNLIGMEYSAFFNKEYSVTFKSLDEAQDFARPIKEKLDSEYRIVLATINSKDIKVE